MSPVVLDTHALIWLMLAEPDLGEEARRLSDEAARDERLFVSAITFWEIGMLAQRKRIALEQPLHEWRIAALTKGVEEVPVSGAIGIEAAELPDFHGDPADRIIAATALQVSATLVTADANILQWPGNLSRHNARK